MTFEDARQKATEYAARADDAFDDETRRLFLQLRDTWTRLAESLAFEDENHWPNGLAA